MQTYSRYIPNGSGGFSRTTVTVDGIAPQLPGSAGSFVQVQEAPVDQPQQPERIPPGGQQDSPGAQPVPKQTVSPGRRGPPLPLPGQSSPASPSPRGNPPLSLQSLLPQGTDLEDLLILLILVLLLLEEGESGTVILCAVLAYFILGKLEQQGEGLLGLLSP